MNTDEEEADEAQVQNEVMASVWSHHRFASVCPLTAFRLPQVLEAVVCQCPEGDVPDAVFSKLSEKLNVPPARLKDRYRNMRENCHFK